MNRSKPLRGRIPCGYCFQEWATCYDHLVPWSKGGKTTTENLYPACRRCNSILCAKLFKSLDEKRLHVKGRLIERGEWRNSQQMCVENGRVPELQEVVREEEVMVEILQSAVPVGEVEHNAPKNKIARRKTKQRCRLKNALKPTKMQNRTVPSAVAYRAVQTELRLIIGNIRVTTMQSAALMARLESFTQKQAATKLSLTPDAFRMRYWRALAKIPFENRMNYLSSVPRRPKKRRMVRTLSLKSNAFDER